MSSRLACVLLAGLMISGCGGGKSIRRWFGGPKEFPKATAENPAVEVVSVWQPAEGTGVNGLPSRGFAGQVMFFTRTSPEPVQVNGDVRIYLFDDTGTVEERKKPIHQFDFTPEAWNTHITDGTLGASYNVFIPYTKDNPYQTRCNLRVRIQQPNKPPVFSEAIAVTLPGPIAKTETQKAASPQSFSMTKSTVPINPGREEYEAAVQQASHQFSHQFSQAVATPAEDYQFSEEQMAAIQEKLRAIQKERLKDRTLPQSQTATEMLDNAKEMHSQPPTTSQSAANSQPQPSKRFRLSAAPGSQSDQNTPEPLRHQFSDDFRPISTESPENTGSPENTDSASSNASQLFD